MSTRSRGCDAEVERATFDAARCRDGADHVGRECCRCYSRPQAHDERETSDEFDDSDDGDGRRGDRYSVAIEICRFARMVEELTHRNRHEEHTGDDPDREWDHAGCAFLEQRCNQPIHAPTSDRNNESVRGAPRAMLRSDFALCQPEGRDVVRLAQPACHDRPVESSSTSPHCIDKDLRRPRSLDDVAHRNTSVAWPYQQSPLPRPEGPGTSTAPNPGWLTSVCTYGHRSCRTGDRACCRPLSLRIETDSRARSWLGSSSTRVPQGRDRRAQRRLATNSFLEQPPQASRGHKTGLSIRAHRDPHQHRPASPGAVSFVARVVAMSWKLLWARADHRANRRRETCHRPGRCRPRLSPAARSEPTSRPVPPLAASPGRGRIRRCHTGRQRRKCPTRFETRVAAVSGSPAMTGSRRRVCLRFRPTPRHAPRLSSSAQRAARTRSPRAGPASARSPRHSQGADRRRVRLGSWTTPTSHRLGHDRTARVGRLGPRRAPSSARQRR